MERIFSRWYFCVWSIKMLYITTENDVLLSDIWQTAICISLLQSWLHVAATACMHAIALLQTQSQTGVFFSINVSFTEVQVRHVCALHIVSLVFYKEWDECSARRKDRSRRIKIMWSLKQSMYYWHSLIV